MKTLNLINGPLDGAIVEVEKGPGIAGEGPLDIDGLKYWANFDAGTAHFMSGSSEKITNWLQKLS